MSPHNCVIRCATHADPDAIATQYYVTTETAVTFRGDLPAHCRGLGAAAGRAPTGLLLETAVWRRRVADVATHYAIFSDSDDRTYLVDGLSVLENTPPLVADTPRVGALRRPKPALPPHRRDFAIYLVPIPGAVAAVGLRCSTPCFTALPRRAALSRSSPTPVKDAPAVLGTRRWLPPGGSAWPGRPPAL